MIDWARISELQDDLGEEGFAEMAALFLQEIDTALSVDPPGQPPEAEALMHMIKGCALNIGLAALGDLCAGYEARARAGECQMIDMALLRQVFTTSRQEFARHFGPEMAA